MLGLLGWIPIVGPIIDGVVSIFNKRSDVSLAKYKVDGQTNSELIQSNTQILLAFVNDIPVRIARDIIMFPGATWCGLFIWDKIVEIRYPEWVWGVRPLTAPMDILPLALLTFFFGLSALNILKR